ncbi:MAG: hypothetical protein A2Y92_02655 [Chloroflexi bacterium RBG_13_57_8]|nr:MAG: hypothetical protein A2Y92_02655 [Chloroflexi bacterium RBG_13_57_8]
MKKRVSPILLALTAFVVVWVITAGAAYGATVFQKSLNANVRVIGGEASFEFYANQSATQVVTSVSLPDVELGGMSTFTVYIRNNGSVTETVSAGGNSIPASVGTLTLTFDGQSQATLAPGAVCRVTGTLRMSSSAEGGPLNFSFTINANVAAGQTPTATPTATTLSGQQLFNTYCLSCHASGAPNTDLSGTQLVNFISGHQTGSGLTATQVSAIANFVGS